MQIPSIPGFDVKKIGKDRYSIAVTNGNMGAAVVNKEQLKQIADVYGVPVKDNSKAKKAAIGIAAGLAGAGLVAAGVIYRKNIGKFFKGLKDTRLGNAFNFVGARIVDGVNTVKDAASNGAKNAKNTGAKWFDKAANFAKKAWKVVKEFFVNGWEKITKGFKNLFKKTSDNIHPRDAKGRFVKVER